MIVLYAYVIGFFAFVSVVQDDDFTSRTKAALLWPYHIIRLIF